MKDEYYMEFALRLASAVKGQTSPNPQVGSVIVKEHTIVGFGSHLKSGEAHAEIHALNMAGDQANGATMYVTLEPCNHFGKTPPCTQAIIESGIKEVVIASADRNPIVAGSGINQLQNAGITVRTGIFQEQADQLNESFFHFAQTKQPFVTLKQAITLDGKTATKTGHSKWITGQLSRKDVHTDRGRHDAVLVGIETVLADNPSLTNRDGLPSKQPIRIVLDTHLRTPLDCKLVNDKEAPTWILTGSEVDSAKISRFQHENVEIIRLSKPIIQIDDVLHILAERDITSIYVEGGQKVQASFLKSGNVNRVITYIAPKFIGGSDANGMIAQLDVRSMEEAYPLQFEKVEQLGEDIKITSKRR